MTSPASSSVHRAAALAGLCLLGLGLGCTQPEPIIKAKDYPGALAEAYCTAAFQCSCEAYPYTDFNTCITELYTNYDAVNQEAFAAGLSYDGTCPRREYDFLASLECRGSLPPSSNLCVRPCQTWHGSSSAGFPCQVVASDAEIGVAFSTCGQGLSCVDDVCVDPCLLGPSLPDLGQPCPDQVCAEGAVCDAETMTCVAEDPLPGVGQPCANDLCDPLVAVCVASVDTCAALPAVGQPCVEGQCVADGYCDLESNICVAREAVACGILGGGSIPGDGDGDGDTGDGDGDTGDGDGDTGGAIDCDTFCVAYLSLCLEQGLSDEFPTDEDCFAACEDWTGAGRDCRYEQVASLMCGEAGNLGSTC